jgi:signal transduction histidine kinase
VPARARRHPCVRRGGVQVSTSSDPSGLPQRLARRALASARIRLIVVGLLIAGLVATLSFLLLGSINGFSTASERARHSGVVIAEATALEHQLLGVQTGLRGYAPTGDPRFLQTYRAARATLPQAMADLVRLVSDNPRQTARARAIRGSLDRYLATYTPRALALGRTRATRAQLTSLYVFGEAAMDRMRGQVEAFISAERQLSVARDRRAASSDDAARRHAVLALVGTLALLALLVMYVVHSVLTPIGRAAAAARAMREGDLGVRLAEEHSTEIGDLTTSFNRMADRLQRDQERREALLAQERETNERLRQIDRLKDELVMVVSHELRTPLTSIQGYVDLVLDDEELDPGTRRFLETAQRNAGRLHRLVEDLLTLSSVDRAQLSLELVPLDLAALTAGEVAASRVLAEAKGVAVDLAVPPAGSTMVRADAVRLGQVVDNLVANAVKFTPAGGRVRVAVSAAGDTVCLVVADTGIGIPVDEHEHLFERFFRASTATEQHIPGTGLGLAISKAIVDAHRGTIEVTSAAGRGTTFRVTLPVSAAAPAAA